DRLAAQERKPPQRGHSFLKTIARERRSEGLAEFFTGLGKQEQRDGFRRQQRGVDDQRLGSRVEFGCLLDGKREGLRHRQPVVILGWGVALIIQQTRWRRRETAAIFGKRNVKPLAIGSGLLVGKRQATERLRQ